MPLNTSPPTASPWPLSLPALFLLSDRNKRPRMMPTMAAAERRRTCHRSSYDGFTAGWSRPGVSYWNCRRYGSSLGSGAAAAPLRLGPQGGTNDTPWTDAAQRGHVSLEDSPFAERHSFRGTGRPPGARLESGTRITSRTHCAAAVLPVIVKDEAVRRE
jgi:hypothetical protein